MEMFIYHQGITENKGLSSKLVACWVETRERPFVRLAHHCAGTASCPNLAPTSFVILLFRCKCVKRIVIDNLSALQTNIHTYLA